MEFWLIPIIIFALYARTLSFKYVIDDYVRREEYLWNVPKEAQNPKFFDTQPTVWYRLFMIGMHVVNSFIIYTLWGWQASLIFAIHPLSVWGVAWVTGNYYATTAYFTLISYFFYTQFSAVIGIPLGMLFFYCALNSTVDAMSYPFLFVLTGNIPGLTAFIPLFVFLNRRRWKEGLQTRVDIVTGKQVDKLTWEWNRFALMTKVMARYIETFFFPAKVYYFGRWAEKIRESQSNWDYYHAFNKEFYVSLLVCASFATLGAFISPFGTIWFFVFMGLHSQFKVLGQPFAQRYLYLPQIGICIILGTLFASQPYVIFAMAGFLVCRTWQVIPNWRDQETVLKNEVEQNPDRGGAHSALAQFYISRKKLVEYPHWKINLIASHIRRAVMLEPESWVVSMNFCAFLTMIGKIDEAIKANERTIELLEKYATERERPNIEGAVKQLEFLKNVRVEARKQAKQRERKMKANNQPKKKRKHG